METEEANKQMNVVYKLMPQQVTQAVRVMKKKQALGNGSLHCVEVIALRLVELFVAGSWRGNDPHRAGIAGVLISPAYLSIFVSISHPPSSSSHDSIS